MKRWNGRFGLLLMLLINLMLVACADSTAQTPTKINPATTAAVTTTTAPATTVTTAPTTVTTVRATTNPVATTNTPASGLFTPIYELQGTGLETPSVNKTITTEGLVTASKSNGFFIQDDKGDGNPATSDGLFVFRGSRTLDFSLQPGLKVRVSGKLVEYKGSSDTNSLTELDVSNAASSSVTRLGINRNPLPAPVELNPPADTKAAFAYLEAREGMLVYVPGPVKTVGPTSQFNEVGIVRNDSGVSRVVQDDPQGIGRLMLLDDAIGPVPVATTGQTLTGTFGNGQSGVYGVLDYNFDTFKIDVINVLKVEGQPFQSVPVGGNLIASQFSIANFNVENYFDTANDPTKNDTIVSASDYEIHTIKIALAIRDELNLPTLIGLEEVENATVLEGLVKRPELAGPDGQPLYAFRILTDAPAPPGLTLGNTSPKLDSRNIDPRGIQVALLYRRDRVTFKSVTGTQACTTLKDNAYPTTKTDKDDFDPATYTCATQEGGPQNGNYVFPRVPLVAEVEVKSSDGSKSPLSMTVIVNHFKSKGGDDPERNNYTTRRVQEARALAAYIATLKKAGRANILTLGDFNDYPDTLPMQTLANEGGLKNLALDVPLEKRYSYVYNGVSQVLDQIFVTPELHAHLKSAAFATFDSDYPAAPDADLTYSRNLKTPRRVSDHNPPLAVFELP